ncbi:MAG: sigma-70 family RNA polymerase sigma factor [Planctomycetes bacterium]|nr:sigma-70 family RNA polymerase sigma factor [Planctomycetota bacterium]
MIKSKHGHTTESETVPDSTQDLLASCLQGKPRAWDAFIKQSSPIIFGAVQRVVRARTRDDLVFGVEDITQEVFLRLVKDDYKLLRSYNPDKASLVTWLNIIARSTTIDFLRKKQLPTVPLDPAYHSQVVDKKTGKEDVPVTIPPDLLSPRQKLVLQLFFDRNLDIPEISNILKIEEQTVRSTKHKAISKLRDYLKL